MAQNPSGPRGPLYNGARPTQRQIGPFSNAVVLTGKIPLQPYARFDTGMQRPAPGIKLKRPRTPDAPPPLET